MREGIAGSVRPRVLLNCATSRDGFLAGPDPAPVRLSDETDMQRVHHLRAGSDAILVGVGTILGDDPSLRVKPRYAAGSDPMRVILDTRLRTPVDARVCDGGAPTVIYHASDEEGPHGEAELVQVPMGPGGVDLKAVLADLGEREVECLMVEGGSKVLASFLEQGCWDEWTLYEAPMDLGSGPAIPSPGQRRQWGIEETAAIAQGDGWLRTFNPG